MRLKDRQRPRLRQAVAGGLIAVSRWMAMRAERSLPVQPRPDVLRPRRPADVAFQLLALELLQVGGLGEQEQLVDRLDVDVLDPAEVDRPCAGG